MQRKKKVFKFIFWGNFALGLGLVVYLLLRQRTYVAVWFWSSVNKLPVKIESSVIDNGFIKYYFVDYLWAFSLSCYMHAVFIPENKESIFCTTVVSVFGIVYETLQYMEFIKGTGDILDVIMYTSAGLAVSIMNFFTRRNENEKE